MPKKSRATGDSSLPPRKGDSKPTDTSGNSPRGRFQIPPMVMYSILVALFCVGVGLAVWLPGRLANNNAKQDESNPFLNAPAKTAKKKQKDDHKTDKDAVDDATESDSTTSNTTAQADSNDKLDIKGSIEFIKMLKKVKKPSLGAKDLEQLQELINATKGEKPDVDIHNLAELRSMVRELGGPQAKTGANDISALQDLLHDMSHQENPVEIENVDELRNMLEDLTGRQEGIDTDNEEEVRAFLSEIVHDENAIQSADINRLSELIDEISDKEGELDVDDLTKFRKMIADISGERIGNGLQDVSQLTQMLESATGKQPTAFLDFVSQLKDEPGQQPGHRRRVEIDDLPQLKEAVRESVAEKSKIDSEDVDQFAALTQRLTGRPGKEITADPAEMVDVLKELSGKPADPSVDFVANVDSDLLQDLTRSSNKHGASELARLQKVLESIGGNKNSDAKNIEALGNVLRDLSKSSGAIGQQDADALSNLLGELTGQKVDLNTKKTDAFAKFLDHLAKDKNSHHHRRRRHPHQPVRRRLSKRDLVEKPYLPKHRAYHAIDELPEIIVDHHGDQPDHYATLNEALSKLPAEGVRIVLYGDTPFELKPVTIEYAKTLAIVADSSKRPIVKLSADGDSSSGLQFKTGALHLEGIHFQWDATSSATTDYSMIDVHQADLSVKDCSLTAMGTMKSAATAVKCSGAIERPNRSPENQTWIELHDTLIRGSNLVGLRIEPDHSDVLTRNCMFLSGSAPTLQVSKRPQELASAVQTFHLLSTTLFSNRTACEISAEGDGEHSSTKLLAINSILAADLSDDAKSQMLKFDGVDRDDQELKGISWTSKGSVYLGWDSLAGSAEESWASTSDELSQLWNAEFDAEDFSTDHLLPDPLTEPSKFDFHLVKAERLGIRWQRALDDGWPGSDVNHLHAPQEKTVHDQEFATRPKIPKFLLPPVNGSREVIHVNVMKNDLGRFLKRTDWADGSVVIAEGTGMRKSSPIVIEDKSIRLIFQSTGSDPLVLVPRNGHAGHHVDDAFISVKNGSIEILDGSIAVDTSDPNYKDNLPHWMIQVVDGNLSLQYFSLHGPVSSSTRNKGLIRWVRTEAASLHQRVDGPFENYALLGDAFLSGVGTLIDADVRKRSLMLDNVVANAGFHLMSLNLGGSATTIGAVVDLRHSTLAAAHTFFDVKGKDVRQSARSPLRCFADQCVFIPTGSKTTHATLLRHPDHALVHNEINWVGFRNGYGDGFRQFTHQESEPTSAKNQDFNIDWASLWGEHIRKPLTVHDGVLLVSDLTDRRHITSQDFELKDRCSAHSWGEHGRPIGAHVRRIPK